MVGAGELLVIIGAIVFLFGGSKFIDWIKKFKHAKDEFKKAWDDDSSGNGDQEKS